MEKYVFTPRMFLEDLRAKHPGVMVLMKGHCGYDMYGEDADKALPIAEDILTHEDCGRCFIYTKNDYWTSVLGFGEHNLDRMTRALIRAGHRIAIVDFLQEQKRRQAAGLAYTDDELSERLRLREQEQQNKIPVQLSLFGDNW